MSGFAMLMIICHVRLVIPFSVETQAIMQDYMTRDGWYMLGTQHYAPGDKFNEVLAWAVKHPMSTYFLSLFLLLMWGRILILLDAYSC